MVIQAHNMCKPGLDPIDCKSSYISNWYNIQNIGLRYNMLYPTLERVCTKDYKIPNTDIVVPKGRIVHVFVEGIINSKDNFIDPENFNPENFNPENFTNKFANMAFGQGPRACPG